MMNIHGDLSSGAVLVFAIIRLTVFAVCIVLLCLVIFKHLPKKFKLNKLKKQTKNLVKENEDIDEEITKQNKKIRQSMILIVLLLLVSYVLNITTRFAKPMIYLYPIEDNTKICVELGNPGILTTSYPKYVDNWCVYADRDGTLRMDGSNKEYYGLYWEGRAYESESFKEGFCIRGEDTASFLEEKLKILGLNDREAEEFIVYWLPKLEANKYNLIRFKSMDEINRIMPLTIEPKPDTVIRVMMSFKGIDHEKRIQEQQLEKAYRNGFTFVEWGGAEY